MAAVPGSPTKLIRNVALPVEHGGWAFVSEPMLLGLLLAPTAAGCGLAVAGLAIFLLFRPLQLALKDWRKGRRYPRTLWAERFVLLYGAVALLGVIVTISAAGFAFLPAILLAAPFALLQLWLVLRGEARAALTEVSGAVALAALTPAILLAGGGSLALALALWAVPACRAVTSILYVRARLHRAHGDIINPIPPLLAQAAGLVLLVALWLTGLLPWTAPLAMLLLTLRAAYGLYLSPLDTPVPHIGFQEIAFGLLTVALVVLGMWSGR